MGYNSAVRLNLLGWYFVSSWMDYSKKLVAVADPSVLLNRACQARRVENHCNTGGKLKFGLGDAPPAASGSILGLLGVMEQLMGPSVQGSH